MFKKMSSPYLYYIQKLMMYFNERKRIAIPNISFMALAGKCFCNLAPQYIPKKPPAPKSAPSIQSGAMARPVSAFVTAFAAGLTENLFGYQEEELDNWNEEYRNNNWW